ncbi:MAG: [protein-PII] uridylyltransferase [Gammaproteobacteria bacterium]|nr:[protein-PII] uridylyltransferase [Gammaproteobacteria bacterium]
MGETDSLLCDFGALDSQLENTKNRLSTLKTAIKEANASLIEQFWAGVNVTQLVKARSDFIDEILIRVWNTHIAKDSDIALIAVGGYGRQELHPASDIDILILLQNNTDIDKEAIESLITELWDLGLEIGHSVRDLSECVEEGKKDITVATNLMESRCITGDETLFDELQELSSPEHIWPSRDFFEAKWKEQKLRHQKFHDTAYNLEPNIKEGPGNLRDIQMIGWVTKRHFNADSLHELVSIDFLNEKEYETLIEGQCFLWKIRFALHAITGRREDRLVFEHQPVIAQKLGFQDEQPNLDQGDAQRAADGRRLGVELFMKKYFRTINELSRLNEMLLQLYQEAILYADEPGEPIPINRRFQSRKGFLEVTSGDIFLRYPYALLELFLIMQQHPELKGVRASTVRLVRQHHFMIDFKFRHDIRCRSIFMEFMRQPVGITHELRRMNQYGVLAAYLPEFGNIVGQMQYDLFHVYTVDQHTLFVVRNLRRFAVPEFKDEYPLCSRIIAHIPKPELLYIAGLFHDIAKGRGGDHSVLGAEDVVFFCERHDLSKSDTDLVSWLIRNHLYMSMTAQHRDIDDPEVINEFASNVENRVRLDYLYLLTVADMRGTNPKLWNSWKDALLIELYKQTRNAFLRGLENPMDKPGLIRETKALAQKKFDPAEISSQQISEFWKKMREDYFIRYNTEEIYWHAQNLLSKKDVDENKPIILMQPTATRGSTDIFIHTRVKPYLMAIIAGTLDQLGLNIVEARIVPTKDEFTMDTYGVLEYNNDPISDPHRLHEVEQRLTEALEQMELPQICRLRDASRQIEHFSIPVKVSFNDDNTNKRTIMEVVATDRPGLLSRIAKAITDSGINLQNAKISTIGAQAEDVFFITDTDNQPIQSIEKREEIRCRIIEYLTKDD